MKKEIKIWLEEIDIRKLKSKAHELGFEGKGFLSHYITKIARESIAFIPRDVEVVLRAR